MRIHPAMLAGTLVVALSLGLPGCTSPTQTDVTPPPVDDTASQPPVAPLETPMNTPGFAYLEGFWILTASAPQIEPASVSPEEADPSGTWEFMVLGDSMTVYVGDLAYVGLISEADGGWSYNGMARGATAQGDMRSGYIELDVTDSETGFAGSLTRLVDAEGDTPAHTGTWVIEGTRQ